MVDFSVAYGKQLGEDPCNERAMRWIGGLTLELSDLRVNSSDFGSWALDILGER
jgi:hypothetical protein